MVNALGVTQEDKAVTVDYVDGKIVIEKISHDKGRQWCRSFALSWYK